MDVERTGEPKTSFTREKKSDMKKILVKQISAILRNF